MDISKMTALWADYVFEGKMSPEVRAPIAESWRRCRAAGLNPSGGEGRHIDANVLESARTANKLVLEIAAFLLKILLNSLLYGCLSCFAAICYANQNLFVAIL